MNKLTTNTRAYLDIETTGFSRCYHDLAVIGIAVETLESIKTIQLVGNEITDAGLINALQTLLLYNREDVINLKTIREKLGVK